MNGKEADAALGRANITVNKNSVPNDPKSPFVTSGIRLGTPAATTRGLCEEDFTLIGKLIALATFDFENSADHIRAEVDKICKKYPLYED